MGLHGRTMVWTAKILKESDLSGQSTSKCRPGGRENMGKISEKRQEEEGDFPVSCMFSNKSQTGL